MVDALAKGDEVVTVGGMLGKVSKIGDNYLGLEVANGVDIQIQRSAVGSRFCPKAATQVMNRYPVWKYAIILIALVVGAPCPCPTCLVSACRCRCRSQSRRSRWTLTRPCWRVCMERPSRRPPLRPMPLGWMARRCGPVSPVPDDPAEGQGRAAEGLEPRPNRPAYVVALNLVVAFSGRG